LKTSLQSERQYRVILGLSALGLGIRLLPLLHSGMGFSFYLKDSPQYVQLDNGLVSGCGFARLINGVCQQAELLRTPMYPVFLAVLPNIRSALAVQSFIGSLICLMLGLIMLHLWSYRAALVSIAILAFDVPSIVVANQVMTEQLFTLLLLGAVLPPLFLILRPARDSRPWRVALFCGLSAAAAVLTRPIGIVLPVIVAIPFLLNRTFRARKRLELAAVAMVLPLIAIAGWSVRNYRLGNYFGLSTVSGITLYYYRAPGVLAETQQISFDRAQDELGHQIAVPYEHIFEARYQSSGLTHQMKDKAKNLLLAHPKLTIILTIESTLYNALTPMRSELANWLQIGSRDDGLIARGISIGALEGVLEKILTSPLIALLVIIQIVANGFLWLGVALAFTHCPNSSTQYRIWCLYLGFVGLLFLALAGGVEANARFRVPALPLLSVVAALGYGFRGPSTEGLGIAQGGSC
jgi:hypothetical protein